MTAIQLQSLAQMAGGRLINGVLEGVLLAIIATVLLRVACRNSGTRFAVCFSTLLTMAGLAAFAVLGHYGIALPLATAHINLPESWAVGALIVWETIAGVGLVRLALAVRQICRLHSRATRLDLAELSPELRGTVEEFSSARRVAVCLSDDIRVPTAIGFFRPAVLIPRWAMNELSPEELRAVLLHELGHLRRWDDWTNLAQKIVRALLFFHPAVWWIDSRLTLERESACDDLVLAETSNNRGYAECLVSVAEKSLLRTGLALALGAVSRLRQTAVRVTRILDHNRLADTRVSKPAMAAVTVIGLASLVVLQRTPELVVFGNGATPSAIAQAAPQVSGVLPAAYHAQSKPSVIEASLHESALSQSTLSSQRVLRRRTGSSSKPELVKAKTRRLGSSPMVVRASASDNRSLGPSLFFVVQTAEFDDNGDVNSTVQVWHLTIIRESQITDSQNGIIWKLI